ncbi:MAG TPA: HD domain-containing protein [Methanospirillum sp.]|uniref:HD domain-containing protein n=1 Tax=Methanospirillum sp. TaxID=45200 RepID=UPI001BD4D1D1|nr:HD domain-containing protein [Methanospirillum sp.]HPY59840.1 HD domain-containing protein [Methanospirillum sp.]
MKSIKDPVHGYIQVDSTLLPLLDTPQVQRLRYIRQLGFSYLVYPGAHHTRFEHSLGTMHLVNALGTRLSLSPYDHAHVSAAGLLHDIGHGPFSHAIEGLSREFLGRKHTDIYEQLSTGNLGEVLSDTGLDPDLINRLINGDHPLSGIIHGDLDVDRMDYLLRDAHYTGVPYGTVDAMRLIRAMRLCDTGIMLDISGVQAAESLLIARTLMRPAVYYHHVSRIAEKMFTMAVYQYIKDDPARMLTSLLVADDAACMQYLLQADDPLVSGLAKNLYERKLFKRALYVGKDDVRDVHQITDESFLRERDLAEDIALEAGVSPGQVMVDIPAFPRDIWMDVMVKERYSVSRLEEVSPLVTTLNETRRSQWRLGVYAPEGMTDAISEAARKILSIKPFTRQERLI